VFSFINTTEFSYLAPAKRGDTIIADAKVLKFGKKLTCATIDIRRKSDQLLLATGRQTMAVPHVTSYMSTIKSRI
jgi:acyl-coenzyme A thioesterase PaaI-like protein